MCQIFDAFQWNIFHIIEQKIENKTLQTHWRQAVSQNKATYSD